MFSKNLLKPRRSLALRLTSWYAGIFAASSVLAFALVYLLIVSIVQARTDEELEEDVEEYAELMRVGGIEQVMAEMTSDTQGEEGQRNFFRVWSSDGRPVIATDLSSWPELDDPRASLDALVLQEETVLETLMLPQREHPVRTAYGQLAPGLVLQIGESLEDDEELLDALLAGFLTALAAVIVLGGPIGWFMARRALAGLQAVTRTATEIADGALDRRVVVGSRGDELDTLARTFNLMLDRIQALIVGMREMTDNLAHDLRSPIARIRASAEAALAEGASQADSTAMVATAAEECDRLLEMVNTTLDIAEAESGAARLNYADIDLVELVRDAVELFQAIAEDREAAVVVDLPDRCRIEGDRQWLQRVVANVLDNALKYMPPGGRIGIELVDEPARVRLAISDTGIGLSGQELERIFDRFYRGDRSRSEPGNGLGLSLALAFVRAHGGDILVDSALGQGSTFTMVLPRRGFPEERAPATRETPRSDAVRAAPATRTAG